MFVEIENLAFGYKNSETDVIKNISLQIKQGDIVSILGVSGSGKSTILRLISGLEEPTTGVIRIGGKIMVDDRKFVLPEKRGIGMVFQDYALFPHMTVKENILFGLQKRSKKEKAQRLCQVLELANLTEFEGRYPYELSGGQQQRVALARALAPQPSLLLLDEPFSNLDAHLQARIRAELREIIKTVGITSIFVTHDQEDALKIADQVVVLQEGQILQVGRPEEVLKKISN